VHQKLADQIANIERNKSEAKLEYSKDRNKKLRHGFLSNFEIRKDQTTIKNPQANSTRQTPNERSISKS